MGGASKRVRVLIADDEVNIADGLELVLESHGLRAIPVYSGESAVEDAQTLKPDILISDVNMRGMSGVDAAEEILASLPQCRVLLISGQTAIGDLKAVYAAGREIPVPRKPFHPDHLLRPLA